MLAHFLQSFCRARTILSKVEVCRRPIVGHCPSRLIELCVVAVALIFIATPYANANTAPTQTVLPHLPKQRLRFDHLSLDQGLASPIVWDVLQDHEGFMWFATFDGLQRYDGYRLKTYLPYADDPHSLSGNQLRVLYEDHHDVLWIGTWNNGLNWYNHQTDQFTRYQHDPANPSSLGGNAVRAILEDHAGNLWIGTEGGLSRFDPSTQHFVHYQHDPTNPQSLAHNDVYALYEDQAHVLWVGTFGGGLDRFDPATGHFTHYHHNPGDPFSLSTDNIYTAITEDQAGNLWIGTWEGGLERLDRSTGRFTHFRHDPTDPASLSYDTVASIYLDTTGELWIGTWGGGLNRFEPSSGSFLHEQFDPLDPTSLSSERVVAFAEDRSGMLWMGTEGGGISQLDRYKQQFTFYHPHPTDSTSMDGNEVYAIAEDHEGDWWIGTSDGGLNRLDRSTGQFVHYRHDPDNPTSLSRDAVLTIYEDRDSTLWIGTLNGGLNQFDRHSGEFIHYQHSETDSNSLSSNQVNTIYEDRAGSLWIGTANGLNRLDRQTGRFTRYQHNPDDSTSLSAFAVRTILEDHAGHLWIGTRGGGLNRFNRQTGTFVHYQHNEIDSHSLSSNSVLAIHEDQAGSLWVGTEDGGLNQFNPITQQVVALYRKQDGLPSDSITSILEDGLGNLWLGTSHGLARFTPATHDVRAYDVNDGLPITVFELGAAQRSRDGELIFGGINGFVTFDPVRIKDDPSVPPIALTDFQLANKPVSIGADSPLSLAINDLAALTLSYEDRVVSIEFAALSYHTSTRNRYRYRLEGFDKEWTEVDSSRRFVTYTNLDPGSYVFHVVGSNSDGVWNDVGRSLHIRITPPWWQTSWFRSLGALMIIIAGVGGYRWRVYTLATHNHQLAAQVAERTRTLAQRTDELANTNEQLQHEIAERIQAEQALQQANRTLEQRVSELSALNQIAEILAMWTNLHPMLEMVGTMMARLFDASAISIWRLNPTGETLTRLSSVGQGAAVSGCSALDLQDDVLAQRVLLQAQATVVTQRTSALLLMPPGNSSDDGADNCLMVLPLQAGTRQIGLVAIRAAQAHSVYTPADVALAQTIVGALANAIENARLSEAARFAAVEEERKRLARELHDSISQELFAASITADVLPQLWELDPMDGQQALGDIQRLTRSALAEMRTLLVELRPAALTRAPLHELLDYLITAASARSNATVVARLESAPALPEDVQVALYRIVQEAFNNIIKHAYARHVNVTLQAEPTVSAESDSWHGELLLRVVDDGRGFDPAHTKPGRLGLESMQERARMIGAALHLSSQPGQGTELTIIWSNVRATKE